MSVIKTKKMERNWMSAFAVVITHLITSHGSLTTKQTRTMARKAISVTGVHKPAIAADAARKPAER